MGTWVDWSGGTQPVDDLAQVEVRFRSGAICDGFAEEFVWGNLFDDQHRDIVAYRQCATQSPAQRDLAD